jgi:hypothetical protein
MYINLAELFMLELGLINLYQVQIQLEFSKVFKLYVRAWLVSLSRGLNSA